MLQADRNQILLIALGILVSCLLGVFFYRELFPEYKIYQNAYTTLEEFRSQETGKPVPLFERGIKQVLLERADRGPAEVDRCISCHVALEYSHFSPTKLSKSQEGEILKDAQGIPIQIPNEEYVWKKLDEAIAALSAKEVNEQLKSQGKTAEVSQRMQLAEHYKSLKVASVGEHHYNMEKVLIAHPLIGKETRPFEFHPIDDYGCTSCHNGNGKALTTEKAHGPVFDGQYEIAHMGHKMEFLEKDPLNDPPFAHIFNSKPGHSLLFQTTPLFVGGLIEAKCVQCHQQDNKETDVLLKSYLRGQTLFMTQSCYACHRIAGFSRGGVGPELTYEGMSYPWFVKESVVWPQADLKTSTMPNFHLDHAELEPILTFLLGQQGRPKTFSETAYKTNLHAWEAGQKTSWEEPLLPQKIGNVRYGMQLFATEGCAACHRLKGFESNVGYKIETTDKGNSVALHKESEWFKRLIPEDITGSALTATLDEKGTELDAHIAIDVRSGALLDELDPQLLMSFYPSFRYAERSKNHAWANSSDKLKQWNERLYRVLMLYIQEYGLGRLIGPRPNWSGVYRSDHWLMEHFRNPGGSTPNSIMPVFPFDDTKFFALTLMLDTVGSHNKSALQRNRKENGFSPEEVFKTQCSQCHGEFGRGDGPVAPWIYPIPKNLRNADFLRNLTRHQAILSITHGVKGTPMPPWGEAPHKEQSDSTPLLNAEQIALLVDWLFSQLPGGEMIRNVNDIPKWHYTTQNIIKELKEEGHEAILDSSKLFEEVVAQHGEIGRPLYFISKSLYTKENLSAGQASFELHCAQCHGRDGDGSGARSSAMSDAKPRMLINIPWSATRDDLWLLRSIKYGVNGTAMTPQGDQTDALQRLQLVMYIRSLSGNAPERNQLQSSLYTTYDADIQALDKARAFLALSVSGLNEGYKITHESRLKAEQAAEESASSLYNAELKLRSQIRQYEKADALLIQLRHSLKREKELFTSLGSNLLDSPIPEIIPLVMKVTNSSRGAYTFENGKLLFTVKEREDEQENNLKSVLQHVDAILASLDQKSTTAKEAEKLDHIKGESETIKKLKQRLMHDFDEVRRLHQIQKRLYNDFKSNNLAPDHKNS